MLERSLLVYTPPDVLPAQRDIMCKQYLKTLCATFTKEWKWEGYESAI